ncbi:MAG: threonine synthase [Nitrososphaerota archaeon]|nr:threonine synthase [Candidatus Bathyarchaeota archaeon]MCX8162338.1 threonine synthase [Candidatus Bathyarchaeota archaeon]MDW8061531.1 threonine synthase [Nitrososphaerota archaeon]
MRCPLCGLESREAKPWDRCIRCGSILMYEAGDYGYRLTVDHDIHSMWRYSSAIPIRYNSNIVTLSEGFTPAIKAENLGRLFKLSDLYIKDEGRNPTGSFRDRCASIMATDALRLGFEHLVAASNGNMGASLAAYARRAHLHAHIVIPRYVDEGKLAQMIAYGADIIEYGIYVDESIDYVSKLAYEEGWYQATPELNTLSFEALKTIAFEIWEELGVPDTVIVPVGGGSLLVSLWKGFRELEAIGLAKTKPRLVCVQTDTLHPIVDRFRGVESREHVRKVSRAKALLVARPVLSDLAVKALKDTGGWALTVSDSEIMKAMILLARCEGVFAEFSSASSVASVKKLIDEEMIDRDDVTVCIVTSSGLKTATLIEVPGRRRKATILYGGKPMKIRVLELLSSKPRYGYDIWKDLGGVVSLQAVYQHLEKLEAEGLISSYISDGRRYYQISDKGVKILEALKTLER